MIVHPDIRIIKLSIVLSGIFLLYSCNNKDGWTSDRKNYLIQTCFSNGKDQLYQPLKLKKLCECSIEKFVSEFSWKEYQEILHQENFSVDLNNRLNLIIQSLFEDCEIIL